MTTALTTQADSPLAALLAEPERLKELPIDTVERLFGLHREMQAEQAKERFHAAFNAAQRALAQRSVRRTKRNTHTGSMYADAADVFALVDPIITAHGFSRSLSTEASELTDHVRYVLTLRNAGHEERHYWDAPIDDVGAGGKRTKTRLHGMASSATYVERHLVCKVFGVRTSDDDDDGNAGAGLGPGAETISVDQETALQDLVREVGANMPAMLQFFRVPTLGALPASRFDECRRMLEAKRK